MIVDNEQVHSSEELIAQVLTCPDASLLLKQLQSILADEQERRQQFYRDVTEDQKAEFINGQVIIHSPVKLRHNEAGNLLMMLLNSHVIIHNLGWVGQEKITISLTRNDYQPDICFFKKEQSQHFQPDQMLFPAPDFITEILSPSTAKNDRGLKFRDYAAHGVREYWLVDPQAETIEQYVLNRTAEYELLLKSGNGWISSRAITDFTIPIRAVFDQQENIKTLAKIMAGLKTD